MLTLAGDRATPRRRRRRILALETQIAERHWPIADRRERDKTYNRRTRAELRRAARRLSRGRRTSRRRACDRQPASRRARARRRCRSSRAVRRDAGLDLEGVPHLPLSLRARADVLPKAFDDEDFDFYGRTLNGQPQQRERWKRAVGAVERRARRSRRRALRDASLPAGGEGARCSSWSRTCARPTRQRIDALDLDDAGDEGRRAREARDVPRRRSATRTSGATTRALEVAPATPFGNATRARGLRLESRRRPRASASRPIATSGS